MNEFLTPGEQQDDAYMDEVYGSLGLVEDMTPEQFEQMRQQITGQSQGVENNGEDI